MEKETYEGEDHHAKTEVKNNLSTKEDIAADKEATDEGRTSSVTDSSGQSHAKKTTQRYR